MAKIVKCQTLAGQAIEYVDEIIGSGAMKDVYFSPDKSYVVALYKARPDSQARERLKSITTTYWDRLFNEPRGDYWKNLFC